MQNPSEQKNPFPTKDAIADAYRTIVKPDLTTAAGVAAEFERRKALGQEPVVVYNPPIPPFLTVYQAREDVRAMTLQLNLAVARLIAVLDQQTQEEGATTNE